MEETEKQKLRELKSFTVARLQSINVDSYGLCNTDARLRDYVLQCISDPDAHNLYEHLSITRFFRLLDTYEFRPKDVIKFIRFYERLKFTGKKGKTRYKLTPIQVFQFANILGFYKSDGKRLCREALLFVPRKFSKTTSVASIAIYDLLFGDANAQAYVGANSYDQAQICFREIKSILSGLDKRLRYFKLNREVVYNRMKGKSSLARCLATNPDKLDGLNASVVILDEYSQANSADLKNVLTSSMGVRENPLTIVITTASDKIDAPFFEMLQSYKAILRGEQQDDTIFAHIFEPDVDDEEDDERTWKKVQPHWGITIQPDFYAYEYNKALRSSADMKDFRNKLLNIFAVDEAKAWISADFAQSIACNIDIDKVQGRPETMVAIDLSVHDDFSAVSYTVYSKLTRSFFAHTDYYFPEGALQGHPNEELYRRWVDAGYLKLCKGDVIDYRMIVEDILTRNKTLLILQIGYDAYKSQECVNMLGAAGAMGVLKAVPQTYGNFSSPVESFEYAARTGKLKINNNPINFYCFGNAVLDTDRNENKKPIKRSQFRKIDGVITMLMTFWLFNNYEQ